MAWVENVTFRGTGPTNDFYALPSTSWTGGAYVIGCEISNTRYGFTGSETLVRNSYIHDIGDDAFVNNGMIVNSRVERIVIPAGSGYHSDVVQFHDSGAGRHNVIVYNLEALDCNSQGWHVGYTGHVKGADWSDLAFVNVLIEATATQQWSVSANHVLWWHMSAVNGPVYIRDNPLSGGGLGEATTIRNFSLRQSVFNSLSIGATGMQPYLSDVSWASGNHFISSGPAIGTDTTYGGTLAQLFVDYANNGYDPRLDGVLATRQERQLVPVDSRNHLRSGLVSVGARTG
jgi:hypothetical protein